MSVTVVGHPTNISQSGTDKAWVNPSNAGASDNSRTISTNPSPSIRYNSNPLKCQGYSWGGGNIPVGAINLKLNVGVECSQDTAGPPLCYDYSLKLLDADGNEAGNNLALSAPPTGPTWSDTDVAQLHPSDGTLVDVAVLGIALTPALLNSANFGVSYVASLGESKAARVDDVPITVSYDAPEPTGDWTYTTGRKTLSVDATGVTIPEGFTPTYSWDWGDESAEGSGISAAHTYAAGGTYTVVLTITYDSGDTFTISKEVTVPNPTITRVSPKRATLGATGTACTLTVTNAGATQDTSTLTVGGVAVIVDTWGDTSITFHLDDDPATPYGGQDIVLTVGGVAATMKNGIYVYNATDNDAAAKVLERYLSDVWIDGIHVGYTGENGFRWRQKRNRKSFTPDDTDTPAIIKQKIIGYELSFTLQQLYLNATLLPAVFGGTWDDTGKTLKIMGQALDTEHSIMIVDSNGIIDYWSRCMLTGDLEVQINKNWSEVPLTFEAMADADEVLHQSDYSALSWS